MGKKNKKGATGKQQKKERMLRKQHALDRNDRHAVMEAIMPAVMTVMKSAEQERNMLGVACGFPMSDFYRRGHDLLYRDSYDRDSDDTKAIELLLQGCKTGCVPSMAMYGILGYPHGRVQKHLALPWLTEAAIRGHTKSMGTFTFQVYTTNDVTYSESEHSFLKALKVYWLLVSLELAEEAWVPEVTKNEIHDAKKLAKGDLKKGNEVECKQLAILKQYHRPYAVEIAERLIVGGENAEFISELQELRTKLGLNRPRVEYEEFANNLYSYPTKDLLGRSDGTVQMGSYPDYDEVL